MMTMTFTRHAASRLLAVGALTLSAIASIQPAAAMPGRAGGMHQDGGGMPLAMARPERMDRMLEDVGASAEQRSQVRAILDAARKDLQGRHQSGQALHEQGRQIFTAPTVDARAAEAWRQQVQAQREEASKRMLQAMIDVSRVLTPEQRAKIADRMGQRHAMMEHRHRGDDQPAR